MKPSVRFLYHSRRQARAVRDWGLSADRQQPSDPLWFDVWRHCRLALEFVSVPVSLESHCKQVTQRVSFLLHTSTSTLVLTPAPGAPGTDAATLRHQVQENHLAFSFLNLLG